MMLSRPISQGKSACGAVKRGEARREGDDVEAAGKGLMGRGFYEITHLAYWLQSRKLMILEGGYYFFRMLSIF